MNIIEDLKGFQYVHKNTIVGYLSFYSFHFRITILYTHTQQQVIILKLISSSIMSKI